jgi:hypothetical protein
MGDNATIFSDMPITVDDDPVSSLRSRPHVRYGALI